MLWRDRKDLYFISTRFRPRHHHLGNWALLYRRLSGNSPSRDTTSHSSDSRVRLSRSQSRSYQKHDISAWQTATWREGERCDDVSPQRFQRWVPVFFGASVHRRNRFCLFELNIRPNGVRPTYDNDLAQRYSTADRVSLWRRWGSWRGVAEITRMWKTS